MARKCYVKTCSNSYSKTKNICVIDEKNCSLTIITYHSFPRQPYLRQKWIEATGRSNWQPSNGSYICSEHFKESDYDIMKQKVPENDDQISQIKRLLKRNAIPTQQLGNALKPKHFGVYSNQNNAASSDTESITSAQIDAFTSGSKLDLNKVKEEPDSPEELDAEPQHPPPFIITSAVTVKEENDHSDRHNGVLETQISPRNYSFSNHVEYRCDYSSSGHIRAKRLKHQDSLIAPEDIKIEKCSSPLSFNHNISIEEKYERLLDEFLKLKRDYDLLKFKFDFQRDAISKCEQILSGCR